MLEGVTFFWLLKLVFNWRRLVFCFQRAPRPQSSIGAENVLKWRASNTLKKLRSLTPEDHAHKNIDHQLESCGWVVDNISNMAVMSVSLREYHSTNESPEVKKGTANTSPKRERVNQRVRNTNACHPPLGRVGGSSTGRASHLKLKTETRNPHTEHQNALSIMATERLRTLVRRRAGRDGDRQRHAR